MGAVTYDEPEQVFDEAALGRAAREAIEFVEPQGWGQPPQLFGLVPTSLLATSQPEWADILDDGASLTVIEQEPLPGDPRGGSTELNHVLATTTWPDEVVGCALVQEIIVLPPNAEADLDGALEPHLADVDAADRAGRAAAESHPGRRTARMVAAVLRDGHRITLLMLQPEDDDPFADSDLLRADQLAPGLIQGLLATFDDD
ncbi:PPA1309 family protein [Tsukamurella ocularis]|uniref:PPA1309 family protein n=1 Tax=Tsukamurella ocularis TaxID=1970234 RepID=UPI00216A9BFF|nr:PPA1309 family protein [Tsukamurella ocularis]